MGDGFGFQVVLMRYRRISFKDLDALLSDLDTVHRLCAKNCGEGYKDISEILIRIKTLLRRFLYGN